MTDPLRDVQGIDEPVLEDGTEAAGWDDGQGYPLDDAPQGLGFGTTSAELREGESLDDRLKEEVPDRPAGGGDVGRAGRVVETDEGVRGDTEADLVAHEARAEPGDVLPEEAAMHVVDEDGGLAER